VLAHDCGGCRGRHRRPGRAGRAASGKPRLLDVRGGRGWWARRRSCWCAATGDRVVSRVLAGTTARGRDPADDQSRVDASCTRPRTRRTPLRVESLVERSCRTCATSTCRRSRTCSTVQRHAPRYRRDGDRAGRFGRARPARCIAPDGCSRRYTRPAALELLGDSSDDASLTGPSAGSTPPRRRVVHRAAVRQLDGRTARLFAGLRHRRGLGSRRRGA